MGTPAGKIQCGKREINLFQYWSECAAQVGGAGYRNRGDEGLALIASGNCDSFLMDLAEEPGPLMTA
jgi:hypothetical protein